MERRDWRTPCKRDRQLHIQILTETLRSPQTLSLQLNQAFTVDANTDIHRPTVLSYEIADKFDSELRMANTSISSVFMGQEMSWKTARP